MTKPNTCTKNKKGIIPTYYLLACPRFSIFIRLQSYKKYTYPQNKKREKLSAKCEQNTSAYKPVNHW